MEKGDLEKYDDFLDCKIVKSKVFKKISDIKNIGIVFLHLLFSMLLLLELKN